MIVECLVHEEYGVIKNRRAVATIGHRVVHGGGKIHTSVIIDRNVKSIIEEYSILAPLHNPPNLEGIKACDVSTYYSTILSLWSNPNCKTVSSFRFQRDSSSCGTRQAISSHLSLLRGKGHCNSQLDPTHDTGSELGCHTGVDNLSISEALLFSMSPYQYREFRSVSSLLAGNPSSGALYLIVMNNCGFSGL